jgi:hypothetical protein
MKLSPEQVQRIEAAVMPTTRQRIVPADIETALQKRAYREVGDDYMEHVGMLRDEFIGSRAAVSARSAVTVTLPRARSSCGGRRRPGRRVARRASSSSGSSDPDEPEPANGRPALQAVQR